MQLKIAVRMIKRRLRIKLKSNDNRKFKSGAEMFEKLNKITKFATHHIETHNLIAGSFLFIAAYNGQYKQQFKMQMQMQQIIHSIIYIGLNAKNLENKIRYILRN
jgi:hypothetical protein